MSVPVYIFDIDGTCSDPEHRQHFVRNKPKDWKSFHAGCKDDPPHRHICGLASDLLAAGRQIIFVTGRAENNRRVTETWLVDNIKDLLFATLKVYMREDDDFREDYIVKGELLEKLRKDGYEPIMAFDDRDQVVKFWRSQGIPCAQVAEGDF